MTMKDERLRLRGVGRGREAVSYTHLTLPTICNLSDRLKLAINHKSEMIMKLHREIETLKEIIEVKAIRLEDHRRRMGRPRGISGPRLSV
eukprot:768792-Hanusia_phi.AAC.5